MVKASRSTATAGSKSISQSEEKSARQPLHLEGLAFPGFCAARRWRATSYITTAPATETFSEGTWPSMGMETRKSQRLRTRSCSPLPSAPEHDGAVHVVVKFVVALRAALVEADSPDIAFFQLVQRARDVGDARDRQMLRGPGGSFDHGARQPDGAAFGNDDAVGAGAVGGANQRAQVVRVFHAVEHDQEAVLAVALLQQRVHVGILLAAGDGDDALVGVGVGGAVKLLARQEADLHAAGAAVVDQALHPLVMALAGDAHVIKAARARLQRLADRMNAVDDDHVSSVYDSERAEHSYRPVRSARNSTPGAFILVFYQLCFPGARMSISAVIVDDEQLARDELAYLLSDLDVDVVAQGKNGVEAVNLVKELSPDLVFLDVQMPGLDGFGVIKKLLDQKVPLPQIVFATAFDQYAVKAFEVNAVDYLLKPFDKKRVAQAVEKARQEAGDRRRHPASRSAPWSRCWSSNSARRRRRCC